jgi:predicted MFS family arabinose efflux permease
MLILCYGILTPAGTAASSFPVLMGHISKAVPADKRSIASGVINAGGAAGQFILTPLIQLCISNYGYYGAAVFLACAVALSIVPSWFLSRPGMAHQSANAKASERSATIADGGLKNEVASAFKNPGYLFLHFGFFACGFHVAFLATHLPGEIGFYKYGGSVIALCFSLLAVCNIVSCIAVGIVGRYIQHKNILAFLYGARVVLIGLYLPAPKTVATFVVFSIIAGLTFSDTVPPTGTIAAALVHPKYYSTLFGLIFLTHQIGSFFGAWLGGLVMDNTGSFFLMWVIDAALTVLAALFSLKIKMPR